MDHQGERRNPIVQLSQETIEALLTNAEIHFPIQSVQILSTGYSNTNYKIEFANSKPCVLRVFTNGEDTAKMEIRLLNLLEGKLPVPKVSYFSDNLKIIPYYFALLEWKQGQLLSKLFNQTENEITEIGKALGGVLAQLSQSQFPTFGLFNEKLEIRESFSDLWEFFFPFIEDCLIRGRAGERLGSELTHEVLQFVANHESLLKSESIIPTLVHGDFNGKNILMERYKEKWQVEAILDWEFACSGPYLTDFGNLLRYDAQFSPSFEKGLISGFRSQGGILSKNWKRIAKLLDLMNLCDFLNTKNHKPILWEDSKKLILDTLKRWDTF